MPTSDTSRLSRLQGYLAADPENRTLLVDTCQEAINSGAHDLAESLIQRLDALAPSNADALHLAGLSAMYRRDFGQAADRFARLMPLADTPAVRFNLAWSLAMQGDKPQALALLDGQTVEAVPAAAMLHMQLLHEAGEFDAAMTAGKAAMHRFPDDAGLLAALATLALDLEDMDMARQCADKAGHHPEALAAHGVIALADGDPVQAIQAFDHALAIRAFNPRAWVGKGLASLTQRDPAAAADAIDRGAEQFSDHIGSWIAAGWAHYLAGDSDRAALRFERALAIDPAFAETQGSLAVIAATRGDLDTARRLVTTALRLDRQCFSAAFAQILLAGGNSDKAQALLRQALDTPINDQGLTVASYMTRLALPTVH
jgi:Flp pilus assembly protein TadD